MYSWDNKVVIITGAATGIGAEVVKILLEERVKYVAILDVDEHSGITLEKSLVLKNEENLVKFIKCDVTDEEALLNAFTTIYDEQGYIDVVINNAGIMNDSKKSYKKEIELNVTALVTSSLKALELMRKDEGGKGGTIINISSIAALLQFPITPIYYGTKSAVLQFSNCIGLDEYYSVTGVRVVTICFGATGTALLSLDEKMGCIDKVQEEFYKREIANMPIQSPEAAARGLVNAYKLASSGSTWLVNSNKPALDITSSIKKAYAILSDLVYNS